MQPIADIRRDYAQKTLTETDVMPDAIQQFGIWWDEAVKSNIDEVNAMTLATAAKNGLPDARIVLLKGYDEKGFVFFTNYQSSKGIQMAENPQACLVFFWKELERQVRISGTVEKVAEADSDEYFASRPDGSKVGAWSSPQSEVISSRSLIETNIEKYSNQFAGSNIPRPAHWGGYVVRPQVMEFWQGRPSRLHDRIRYTLLQDKHWQIERLAP